MDETVEIDPGFAESDIDEMNLLVKAEAITVQTQQVETRPDVSAEELALWIKQDPDYPPEHYKCTLRRGTHELVVYQTVGADYPDEDDESIGTDLYADQRELLLSPEFLLETSALKANSVDEVTDLDQWIENGYCQTLTPAETYAGYLQLQEDLLNFLGAELYSEVVRLAIEAEMDREESEE